MQANQIPLVEAAALAATGQPLLPRLRWINSSGNLPPARQAARALFAANCGVCHTESGINGIDQRLAGRSADGIDAMFAEHSAAAPLGLQQPRESPGQCVFIKISP